MDYITTKILGAVSISSTWWKIDEKYFEQTKLAYHQKPTLSVTWACSFCSCWVRLSRFNLKQVKICHNFFPIPTNPCGIGITE